LSGDDSQFCLYAYQAPSSAAFVTRASRGFSSERQVGLVAQEVREVVPQAVVEAEEGYLAVDYARLVPLLIEVVKEQQRQIDELKASLQVAQP